MNARDDIQSFQLLVRIFLHCDKTISIMLEIRVHKAPGIGMWWIVDVLQAEAMCFDSIPASVMPA